MNVLRLIGRWSGRVLREMATGFGLIIRDIHRVLYRRFRARIWWIYLVVASVIILWITGQLWNLVFHVMTLIVILFILRMLVRKAPLSGRKR